MPQAFWFRVAASCPRSRAFRVRRRRAVARPADACALPDLAALDGRASWASVRVGWNAEGLGIAIHADGLGANAKTPDRPEGFATVNLWIDTRDTRNVSRATRYCHRFVARLTLGRRQEDA